MGLSCSGSNVSVSTVAKPYSSRMQCILLEQPRCTPPGDRVYFIECEISGEPKLMEPEKFMEWKWFPINELPENFIDKGDLDFLKRLK